MSCVHDEVGNPNSIKVLTLRPNNPELEPTVLTGMDEGEVAVVAELVEVVTATASAGVGGDGR